MPEDYWEKPCGCGDGRTNLECVTQASIDTGVPLEEAKRIFRRPTEIEITPSTRWSNGSA